MELIRRLDVKGLEHLRTGLLCCRVPAACVIADPQACQDRIVLGSTEQVVVVAVKARRERVRRRLLTRAHCPVRVAVEVDSIEQGLGAIDSSGGAGAYGDARGNVQLGRQQLRRQAERGVARHLLASLDGRFVEDPDGHLARVDVQVSDEDVTARGVLGGDRLVQDRSLSTLRGRARGPVLPETDRPSSQPGGGVLSIAKTLSSPGWTEKLEHRVALDPLGSKTTNALDRLVCHPGMTSAHTAGKTPPASN